MPGGIPHCPPRPAVLAYIGLGANLGDARATLRWAWAQLQALALPGTARVSPLYASAPIDSSGPDYLNAVACLQTDVPAPALLEALLAIEQQGGRERPYRNAPRTLDLDLLLYGDARIDSPALTVPHPRMAARAFVLLPLADLAPERVDAAARDAVADQRIACLGAWTAD